MHCIKVWFILIKCSYFFTDLHIDVEILPSRSLCKFRFLLNFDYDMELYWAYNKWIISLFQIVLNKLKCQLRYSVKKFYEMFIIADVQNWLNKPFYFYLRILSFIYKKIKKKCMIITDFHSNLLNIISL